MNVCWEDAFELIKVEAMTKNLFKFYYLKCSSFVLMF